MEESTTSFSTLLRQLRSAAALSQEELAERAGLSRRGISDLERGLSQAPRLETVRMLAGALALGEDDRAALLAAARPAILRGGMTDRARAMLRSVPTPLTRLIGRETEVMTLQGRLQDADVRWLTLTGPGGVGKTRLAIEVAGALHDTFPDGVVFVDFSPLTDPSLVMPIVATTLGVREFAGQPLLATLSVFLASKRLLLVLDNCERVLAAALDLTRLLAASPGLTIFATSREPFHVRGEHQVPLLPLPLPSIAQLPAIHALAQIPAITLFVEQARAAQPSFALNPENASAVAEICQRLDGLPLAIELAAARVTMLPPVALLARLEKRLPLLIGGGRDLPTRQRTMRAAIAWSYDMLVPEEQVLFRRLSVFAGGFTLAAAAAVTSDPANPALDPFEGVASLVEKSVLRQETGADAEPRFVMLETVREFALEQVAESGEDSTFRERHAAWCLAFAETSALDLDAGRNQAAWFARLDAELNNLRAALTWFTSAGEHANVLQLLSAIDAYWISRPYHAEVLRWMANGLHSTREIPNAVRMWALGLAVLMAFDLGDGPAAIAYAEDALALAQELDDPLALGRAHFRAGLTWATFGDWTRTAAAYEAALSLLRDPGEPIWTAIVLGEFGDYQLLHGDVADAVPLLDEALTIHRTCDRYSLSFTEVLGSRAHAALMTGDPQLAAQLFAESLAVAEEIGDGRTVMGTVAGLAGLAVALGQPAHGVRLLGAVAAAQEATGIPRIAHAEHTARIATSLRIRLGKPAFAAAWDEGYALPFADAVAEARAIASSGDGPQGVDATAAFEGDPS